MNGELLLQLFAEASGLTAGDGSRYVFRDQFLEKKQLERSIETLKLRVSEVRCQLEAALFSGGNTAELRDTIDKLSDELESAKAEHAHRTGVIAGMANIRLFAEWWLADAPDLGIITLNPHREAVPGCMRMCAERGWEALDMGPGPSFYPHSDRHLILCSPPECGIPVIAVANAYRAAIARAQLIQERLVSSAQPDGSEVACDVF